MILDKYSFITTFEVRNNVKLCSTIIHENIEKCQTFIDFDTLSFDSDFKHRMRPKKNKRKVSRKIVSSSAACYMRFSGDYLP